MSILIVLSRFQVASILKARQDGESSVVTSTDLGLTRAEVTLRPAGVSSSGGRLLDWHSLEEIAASENACFHVQNGRAEKIQRFSELTGRFYGLMPTAAAPIAPRMGIALLPLSGTIPVVIGGSPVTSAGGISPGRTASGGSSVSMALA